MKMTVAETNKLLEWIAETTPNPPVTKGRVKLWHKIISPRMTYAEAEKYVLEHFSEKHFSPMPADLIARWQADFNPDDIVPVEPPADMRGEEQHE